MEAARPFTYLPEKEWTGDDYVDWLASQEARMTRTPDAEETLESRDKIQRRVDAFRKKMMTAVDQIVIAKQDFVKKRIGLEVYELEVVQACDVLRQTYQAWVDYEVNHTRMWRKKSVENGADADDVKDVWFVETYMMAPSADDVYDWISDTGMEVEEEKEGFAAETLTHDELRDIESVLDYRRPSSSFL